MQKECKHIIRELTNILDECKIGKWSEWTQCLKCKGGKQSRKREILKMPVFDRNPCPADNGTINYRPCTLDPCPCLFIQIFFFYFVSNYSNISSI